MITYQRTTETRTVLVGVFCTAVILPGLAAPLSANILGGSDGGYSLPSTPPRPRLPSNPLPSVRMPSNPLPTVRVPNNSAPSVRLPSNVRNVRVPSNPVSNVRLPSKPVLPQAPVLAATNAIKNPLAGIGTTANSRGVGIKNPKPGLIDAKPLFHWMATTKPFPNATLANQSVSVDVNGHRVNVPGKGKILDRYPYEVGMRNTTVSDIVITGAFVAAGPGNPLLAEDPSTATRLLPWAEYGAGRLGETSVSGAFKKAHGDGSGRSRAPKSDGDLRRPQTYILSGNGPSPPRGAVIGDR